MALSRAAHDELSTLFPPERRHVEPAACWAYASDNSRRESPPEAVVFPQCLDDVVSVMHWARRHRVPLTARGLGSNTTGASVPLRGGVVVSLERLDRVIEFRPEDRLIVVEAGVRNRTVQDLTRTRGLLWPPDPTSQDYSTIGGNLATHAGGPHAARYGASRRYVLGLVVVAGTGEVLHTGARVAKHSVGYDLTHLFVGSEGTLGIIVEATLALVPRPAASATLRACYTNLSRAVEAVVRAEALTHGPAVCELLDRSALGLVAAELSPPLPSDTGALLLLDVEEDPRLLTAVLTLHEAALDGAGLLELRQASSDEERRRLWHARRALSPALRRLASGKINEDVAVPLSRLVEFVAFLEELGRTRGLHLVTFGHVANGNLHVNVLYDEADPRERTRAEEVVAELFTRVLALGGTLSGEHGVGLAKAPYVPWQLDPPTLEAMKAVKATFDPLGILNPGKIFEVGEAVENR